MPTPQQRTVRSTERVHPRARQLAACSGWSEASCPAHLVEVVADVLPDARPLQTDAAHVVVGDLYNLLQTEHARVAGVRQLV